MKVAFGGVWKQSLTELSGGQRSLLALSLILAMLLFKPAPIYILDEVRLSRCMQCRCSCVYLNITFTVSIHCTVAMPWRSCGMYLAWCSSIEGGNACVL